MKYLIILITIFSTLLLSKELILTQNDLNYIAKLPQSNFILKRFQALEELKEKVNSYDVMQKLIHVNLFFNQSLPVLDQNKYNADDYWATRKEFMINGKGDCEDYVIAKYITLLELGIPKNELYLAVVQVKTYASYHMVLLYNKPNTDTFLVLDNLSFRVLSLKKRIDLVPIVGFNEFESREIKENILGKKINIDWGETNKWEDLLKRIYSKNE